MLGLFKLQGKKKKITVHQPSILQKQPGWPQKGYGRGGSTRGQVTGDPKGLEERKGCSRGRGLIVLMGGVQKARQKRGWGGTAGQCFLHQGTVLEGAWCHPLATPGLGESVTHKPLPQAPFETQMSACPSCHDPLSSSLQSWPAPSGLGAQLLLTPQPHTAASSASGLGSQGTAVWAAG